MQSQAQPQSQSQSQPQPQSQSQSQYPSQHQFQLRGFVKVNKLGVATSAVHHINDVEALGAPTLMYASLAAPSSDHYAFQLRLFGYDGASNGGSHSKPMAPSDEVLRMDLDECVLACGRGRQNDKDSDGVLLPQIEEVIKVGGPAADEPFLFLDEDSKVLSVVTMERTFFLHSATAVDGSEKPSQNDASIPELYDALIRICETAALQQLQQQEHREAEEQMRDNAWARSRMSARISQSGKKPERVNDGSKATSTSLSKEAREEQQAQQEQQQSDDDNDGEDPYVSIEHLLASPVKESFRSFLKFSFAEENLDFYDAVEDYLSLESVDARRTKASEIAEQYIREGSAQEVNVSSELRRTLLNRLAQGDFSSNLFMNARNEVLDLMRRNFFQRFVRKERDNQARMRQREQMSGCFSNLWRSNGVDAYQSIVAGFQKSRNDTMLIIDFIEARLAVFERTLPPLTDATNSFQVSRINMPELQMSAKAMANAFSIFTHCLQVTKEIVNEARGNIVKPLTEMMHNFDSSYKEILGRYAPAIDEIMQARKELDALAAQEDALRQELNQMANEEASLVQQGKKKAAALKKLQTKMGKTKTKHAKLASEREEVEVKFVAVESKRTNDMVAMMDELQSLALYRLDTQQQLLMQWSLAEQKMLNQVNMKLGAILTELMDVSSFDDLIRFADVLQKGAVENRRGSVRVSRRIQN